MSDHAATASVMTLPPLTESQVKPAVAGSLSVPIARGQSVFWLSFWMAVALTTCKAFYLAAFGYTPIDGFREFCRDLWVATHADVLFALLMGVIGYAALRISARFRRLERIVWGAFVFMCAACVAYGIANVHIFAQLNMPLTYPLLRVVDVLAQLRPLSGSFVSIPLIAGLVIGPLCYLAVGLGTKWPRRLIKSGAWLRVGQASGLVTILVSVLAVRQVLAGPWGGRADMRIAQNSHWELLSSWLSEWFGRPPVQLGESSDPADVTDFQTTAERGAGRGPFAHLRARPKNVVVLVLESVGTQYMSLYGSPYDTTPRLAREAACSLVFKNFYCHAGVSANSLVAIALSNYPELSWRETTLECPRLCGTTLAELLRDRGYRTAFISAADNAYANTGLFLSDRGFDDVWDYRDLGDCPRLESGGTEDRFLIDAMVRWIDRDRERPFCLLAWTEQTHWPYEPSDGQQAIDFFRDDLPADAYELGRYLNVLHGLDVQLGRLFDALRERGLDQDTLVIITGDHGETFGTPHDTFGHHGSMVYQENVNVPLILWSPKLFPQGAWSETIGGHIDLNPTVADILGLPAADSWQGQSLFDPACVPRAYFLAVGYDYTLGLRQRNWKYVFNASRGQEELYDLAADATEQEDLSQRHPETCERLRQRLAAWLEYERGHTARFQGVAGP